MVQRGNADFYRPEQPWEEAYPDCSDRDARGEDDEDDGEEKERGGQAFPMLPSVLFQRATPDAKSTLTGLLR